MLVVYQGYSIVFEELFVVFADMGHATNIYYINAENYSHQFYRKCVLTIAQGPRPTLFTSDGLAFRNGRYSYSDGWTATNMQQ